MIGICWMKATYDRRFFFMMQKRKMQKYAAKIKSYRVKYENGIVKDNQWQCNNCGSQMRNIFLSLEIRYVYNVHVEIIQ